MSLTREPALDRDSFEFLGIKARNIPRSSSANDVGRRVFAPRWGRSGMPYDNAMAESFFATLECELLDRHRFKAQARMAVDTAFSALKPALSAWSNSTLIA